MADCRSMPMLLSDTADIVVLQHVIEHFGLGECDSCIAECQRILRPGGSLIVTCPDTMQLAKAWLRKEISDYIYAVSLFGAYMDSELDRHKWPYYAVTLCDTLSKAAAWSQIKTFDWREIPGSSVKSDWWILGVEAVK